MLFPLACKAQTVISEGQEWHLPTEEESTVITLRQDYFTEIYFGTCYVDRDTLRILARKSLPGVDYFLLRGYPERILVFRFLAKDSAVNFRSVWPQSASAIDLDRFIAADTGVHWWTVAYSPAGLNKMGGRPSVRNITRAGWQQFISEVDSFRRAMVHTGAYTMDSHFILEEMLRQAVARQGYAPTHRYEEMRDVRLRFKEDKLRIYAADDE